MGRRLLPCYPAAGDGTGAPCFSGHCKALTVPGNCFFCGGAGRRRESENPGTALNKPASEHLILFTRYPEPGVAKTRLIPALGPGGAAALQRWMTERMVGEMRALCRQRPVRLEIRYAGGDAHRVGRWLAFAEALCRPQAAGDLGHRLHGALARAFAEGGRRVLALGSDCPGLSAAVMAKALDALREHELVLGPAQDGGYYLIGLRSPQPALFADMEWGTGSVLSRTLARAEALGLKTVLLESLVDVDRPEDLTHIHCYSHP